MKITEIEERLKITEKALNEALKELEILKNKNVGVVTPFKEVIDKKVYDNLFDFYYDKNTGKKCPADEERKSANLRNLQNNILMCLGYTYPQKNSKKGFYYAKVQPIKDINNFEYCRLCDLIHNITSIMYDFKQEIGKNDGE